MDNPKPIPPPQMQSSQPVINGNGNKHLLADKARADALLRKILDSQVVYADTSNRRLRFLVGR
jgi:hypothetical protein